MKIYLELAGDHQKQLGYSSPFISLDLTVEDELRFLNSLDSENTQPILDFLRALGENLLIPHEVLNFKFYNVYQNNSNIFVVPR